MREESEEARGGEAPFWRRRRGRCRVLSSEWTAWWKEMHVFVCTSEIECMTAWMRVGGKRERGTKERLLSQNLQKKGSRESDTEGNDEVCER